MQPLFHQASTPHALSSSCMEVHQATRSVSPIHTYRASTVNGCMVRKFTIHAWYGTLGRKCLESKDGSLVNFHSAGVVIRHREGNIMDICYMVRKFTACQRTLGRALMKRSKREAYNLDLCVHMWSGSQVMLTQCRCYYYKGKGVSTL